MRRKYRATLTCLVSIVIISVTVVYLRHQNIEVLNPKGPVALQERNLMITVVLLMLIVVVPVFVLTFFIAWKYRASNGATYRPDWDHSRTLETIWWLVPTLLILVLSVITWRATHELVPSAVLASANPPMTIQVVALDWKWLFIYPQQDIATVNYVQFPVNTPVDFQITADAPMNSFWIPQLGGQIYAMPGMATSLNLLASSQGTFRGSSANISGRGFAGMEFAAHATTENDFESWVSSVKQSPRNLNDQTYAELTAPSIHNSYAAYASSESGLFGKIVLKYMPSSDQTLAMQQMNMSSGVAE
jgi:cytochrome o ubiquinol oxidase subunit II